MVSDLPSSSSVIVHAHPLGGADCLFSKSTNQNKKKKRTKMNDPDCWRIHDDNTSEAFFLSLCAGSFMDKNTAFPVYGMVLKSRKILMLEQVCTEV